MFKNFRNFLFIKRTIRKNKNSETWKKYGLRADWIGRIYAVINLSKEDMTEEEIFRQHRIIEKIKPINLYMAELNLSEITYLSVNKITDMSYLVVYAPYFK
jgi:hypothetical protein